MGLLFGANIDPVINRLEDAFEHVRVAEEVGYDLAMMQDHPYNRRFFDTWTLLTFLAARTERIHLGTNVANLPLRPPAMLAKAAASLDVISGGRVELGLGAGAIWHAIEAFGEPKRSPGEAFTAFKDALHIIRGMWENAGGSFTYKGEFYQVRGAQPGPAPAHPIRLWVGASGPKMLRLTGAMADGVLVSSTYEPPERLLEINAQIDEGAAEAGRDPAEIRRGYNLMGIIDLDGDGTPPDDLDKGVIFGTPSDWVERLTLYHNDYRQDTFVFWPVGGKRTEQLRVFGEEIAPAVRSAVNE